MESELKSKPKQKRIDVECKELVVGMSMRRRRGRARLRVDRQLCPNEISHASRIRNVNVTVIRSEPTIIQISERVVLDRGCPGELIDQKNTPCSRMPLAITVHTSVFSLKKTSANG
ncbi:hypothetical protein EVAR_35237_1 [Eumeta japonica]|uniref:Uncharacterized protein n=1 Tax=Eumeta variegata TaxID=151549 RepID=A0A4C1VDE4_EUMVA|nr:hypothetical protein EVAR_35237_1 [Eumeta japonica]